MSISGGSGKTRFFASLGYTNDIGYTVNSSYERFSARTSINTNPYEWMTAGLTMNYALTNTKDGGQSSYSSTNLFTFIDDIPPLFGVFMRDAQGKKIPDPHFGGYQYDFGIGRPYSTGSNAIAAADLDKSKSTADNMGLNAHINFKFLKYFTLENKFQATKFREVEIAATNPFYGSEVGSNGSITRYNTTSLSWTGLNMLRFNHTMNAHNIEAFVAHEATSYKYDIEWASKKNMVDPNGEHFRNFLEIQGLPDGYGYEYALESYFGQLNYDWSGKYFFSGTVRRDGASRFKNNKWGTFYSIGVAWMLNRESFLKNVDWLKMLKIKASYGTLGQQAAPETYLYYSGEDLYKIVPLGKKPSFVLDKKGNPDLTWEKSNMFQAGLEFNIGNYLEGGIDFYVKNTSDMLFDRRVAPSNGYAIYQVNDGLLRNSGIDFELIGHVLKGKDYFLDIKVNGGHFRNRIITMPLDPSTGKTVYLDESLSGYARAEGHSLYDHYMPTYLGVDSKTGLAQYSFVFFDENGDGKYSGKDGDKRVSSLERYLYENPDHKEKLVYDKTTSGELATSSFIGKTALPTLRGSFNISGGFKGIELSLQFTYGIGGYAYDRQYAGFMSNDLPGKNNFHVDMRKRWKEEGDISDIPRLNAGYDKYTTIRSDRFLVKSDYIGLNNVRLGYNLPKEWISKIKLDNMYLWLSGDNVMLLTARKGFNPTTSLSGASSGYTYPPLTTFTAGIRLGF